MLQREFVTLAWCKLTHNKPRLALSTAGITFAVVLMYVEVGFLHAMYDAQTDLLDLFNADIVISSRARYAMATSESFPRSRLSQAKAVAGVEAAYPLYVELKALWKNLDDGEKQPIRVVAFNPDDPVLLLPQVARDAATLKQPDTLLFDANSRATYGTPQVGTSAELSGHQMTVIGTYRLGPDFLSDGTVIMSDQNYLKVCARANETDTFLNRVQLGLIKLEPGASKADVVESLRRTLPDDIKVQTKEEYLEQERAFWLEQSPVGFVFGFGAALGFLVGTIICYQILYTDVLDHLPQFATLKAIGYQTRSIVTVVLLEAVFLALVGFVPGLLLSIWLYVVVGSLTELPMRLSTGRIAVVLLLTLGMCISAAVFALRRAIQADPAEVF